MKNFKKSVAAVLITIGIGAGIYLNNETGAQTNYNLDIIGYINSQAPVVSWNATKKEAMLNNYVAYYQYEEQINDPETRELIANPETKKQFANRMIQEDIINKVKSVRITRAQEEISYEELNFE